MVKVRQLFILCILVFCCKNLFAQTTISEPSQSPTALYRLFRTNNIWTFIKLDTATGKMWQIQFDMQGDSRGAVELNSCDLLAGNKELLEDSLYIQQQICIHSFWLTKLMVTHGRYNGRKIGQIDLFYLLINKENLNERK